MSACVKIFLDNRAIGLGNIGILRRLCISASPIAPMLFVSSVSRCAYPARANSAIGLVIWSRKILCRLHITVCESLIRACRIDDLINFAVDVVSKFITLTVWQNYEIYQFCKDKKLYNKINGI